MSDVHETEHAEALAGIVAPPESVAETAGPSLGAIAGGFTGARGGVDAGSLGTSQVVALQRSAGNTIVSRLIGAPGGQAVTGAAPPTELGADQETEAGLRDALAARGGTAGAAAAGAASGAASAGATEAASAGAAGAGAGAVEAGGAGGAAGAGASAAEAAAGGAAGAAGGAAGAGATATEAAAGGAAGAAAGAAGAGATAAEGAAGGAAAGAAGEGFAGAGGPDGGAGAVAARDGASAAGGAAGGAGGGGGGAGGPAGGGGGGGAAEGEISGPVAGDLLDGHEEPGAPPSLTEPVETAIDAPEAPTVERPTEDAAVDTSEIESAGQNAQAPSGGLLDSLGSLASAALSPIVSGITGLISGAASGAAGLVGQLAGEKTSETQTQATETAQTAETEAGSASTEAGSAVEEERSGVLGMVQSALSSVSGVPGRVAGMVAGLVPSILGGAGLLPTLLGPFKSVFDSIFGDVPGNVTAIMQRIRQRVDAIFARIDALAARVSAFVTGAITRISALTSAIVEGVRGRITSMTQWVDDKVAGLPGPIRTIAGAVVGSITGMVRSVADRIAGAAQRIASRVTQALIRLVQNIERGVRRVIDRVRTGVNRIVDTIIRGIQAVLARIGAIKDWLVGKAKALLAKALKAVLGPIQERMLQRVLDLIGPALQNAVTTAELMFPNGMPPPPELPAAVQQAASQVPAAGPSVMESLMRPEGDHISVSFTGSLSAAEGVGVQGNASIALLDVVFDYRRNDVGFFISPSAGAQVNVLDASLDAGVGAAASWGTVASFGDPSKDVLNAYGGWFGNVSYGVQGKLAVGEGVQASTGGNIYHGFSFQSPFAPGGTTTPGTPPGTTTTPGTPGTPATPGTPGTPGTPPTPEEHGVVALGDVLFPTQGDDPSASAGAIDAAATAAHAIPTTDPPGRQVANVQVFGHTSRAWRHLPAGMTREQANQALSDRRATNVAARLRPLVDPTGVSSSGAGDSAAAAAGKAETDLSPADQRASISALTLRPGTPGTPGTDPTPGTPGTPGTAPGTGTTPGTPPTTSGGGLQFPINTERAAWGWDTTVGGGLLEGAAGAAGGYLGGSISYSFPLGKGHLSADTMGKIRTAVGFFKLLGDFMSVSPLGFMRDLFGMAVPVATDGEAAIAGATTSFSMPTPSGG